MPTTLTLTASTPGSLSLTAITAQRLLNPVYPRSTLYPSSVLYPSSDGLTGSSSTSLSLVPS